MERSSRESATDAHQRPAARAGLLRRTTKLEDIAKRNANLATRATELEDDVAALGIKCRTKASVEGATLAFLRGFIGRQRQNRGQHQAATTVVKPSTRREGAGRHEPWYGANWLDRQVTIDAEEHHRQ